MIITSRDYTKAKQLAARVGGKSIPYEDFQLSSLRVEYDVLINCTSIGMSPAVHAIPFSEEQIIPNTIVFDAIWNPKETLLLKRAMAKNCTVVYGWEMFVRQALAAQKIWFQGLTGEDDKILMLLENVLRAAGG